MPSPHARDVASQASYVQIRLTNPTAAANGVYVQSRRAEAERENLGADVSSAARPQCWGNRRDPQAMKDGPEWVTRMWYSDMLQLQHPGAL